MFWQPINNEDDPNMKNVTEIIADNKRRRKTRLRGDDSNGDLKKKKEEKKSHFCELQ